MSSMRIVTSLLAISTMAALLVAGCATPEGAESAGSEETVNAGDGSDAGAAIGSSQEALTQRGGWGGGGGGGNACAWLQDGAYCGGNQIPGNPNVLYRCYHGYQSVIQFCTFGCQPMPSGIPDHCF